MVKVVVYTVALYEEKAKSMFSQVWVFDVCFKSLVPQNETFWEIN